MRHLSLGTLPPAQALACTGGFLRRGSPGHPSSDREWLVPLGTVPGVLWMVFSDAPQEQGGYPAPCTGSAQEIPGAGDKSVDNLKGFPRSGEGFSGFLALSPGFSGSITAFPQVIHRGLCAMCISEQMYAGKPKDIRIFLWIVWGFGDGPWGRRGSLRETAGFCTLF